MKNMIPKLVKLILDSIYSRSIYWQTIFLIQTTKGSLELFCLNYTLKTNSAKRYQKEGGIKNVEQGNDAIRVIYVRMTQLWDQLALKEPQLVCSVMILTQLVQFPIALRPEYEHVRKLLLHRTTLPSVDFAQSKLLVEE